MTANQAREQAQQNREDMTNEEMQRILADIKKAVEKGEFHCSVKTATAQALCALRANGYKIQSIGDQRDGRDDYIKISWD